MFASIKDYQQTNAQNIKENIQQFSCCELNACKGMKQPHKTLNAAAVGY